ncbi:dihydrolipoamide acetyltransferase family protein [Aestuariibius sp. 2305UL40-4]|uniref:dihydrolipoamide acetyltransferase family protein n=1 Tax=Aestuariibius violaceus TaxID=3234132 RepID=UPI00345EB061
MGLFAMPSLGADMEAGTLVEWLVQPGDTVKRGDIVAVVETQKGAIEIECFEEGTVKELKAELGQKLPVGAPLALIGAEGEAPREAAPPPVAEPPASPPSATAAEPPRAPGRTMPPAPAVAPVTPPGQVAASPAARIRAEELQLDLAEVKGTGPNGVILLGDIERAAPGAKGAPRPAQETAPPKTGSQIEEMRKAIAAAMTRSKQTIPHFYLSQTIDVQPAVDWLARRNADLPPDQRLLLGALFVRAATLAAARVGTSNGHFTDGVFRPADTVNPGIAIALRGGGLVAPALMDAAEMTLDETMAAMRDLVTRARAGRLRGSEMTAGTITVSSLGETGAEGMAGVIFPPQVALVGLGAPQIRPWVVDGAVEPRTVVTLTLSVDHRVSDARQAARYVAEFEDYISAPESL